MSWNAAISWVRTIAILAGVGLAARWTDAVIRCRELFNSDPWGLASESALVCLSDELDFAKVVIAAAGAVGIVWAIVVLTAGRRHRGVGRQASRSLLAPPTGTFILRD